jgi:hypothetical protein
MSKLPHKALHIIALSLTCLSLNSLNAAEIQASSSELIVDGWRMIMPTISVDEASGKTWVKYTLPDASYQSSPLASGEPIKEKWFKAGSQGLADTPAGYSLEDLDELKNWYMNGGKGHYNYDDGKWTEIANAPPATPSAPPSADDSYGSGPFGGGPISNVPIVSTGSSSTNVDNTGASELAAQMRAEQAKCQPADNSPVDQEACNRYYELHKQYINKMNGN